MTRKQYIAALKKLGLTVASKRTAALLGITVRQSQHIAAGTREPSKTLVLLLASYLRAGLPVD